MSLNACCYCLAPPAYRCELQGTDGLCYIGCPGNSTTWTGSVDTTTHDVTCTLIGCATGTVLCGDYCIATPTVLSGASCTAASAVSHAGHCAGHHTTFMNLLTKAIAVWVPYYRLLPS